MFSYQIGGTATTQHIRIQVVGDSVLVVRNKCKIFEAKNKVKLALTWAIEGSTCYKAMNGVLSVTPAKSLFPCVTGLQIQCRHACSWFLYACILKIKVIYIEIAEVCAK